MKFLLDDNIPLSVKEWLKAKGFDAVKASEIGLKGAEDDKIFEYALKNSYRILTLDLDFGYLFLGYQSGTVIVLRPIRAVPSEIINLLEKSLDGIKDKEGLIIVKSTKIRVIEPNESD